jgi:hypothetical protein
MDHIGWCGRELIQEATRLCNLSILGSQTKASLEAKKVEEGGSS